MESNLSQITYDIELQPGESLCLPLDVSKIVGPGHWQITIKPAQEEIRVHSAFLNGYAPEDEGLYDDYRNPLCC